MHIYKSIYPLLIIKMNLRLVLRFSFFHFIPFFVLTARPKTNVYVHVKNKLLAPPLQSVMRR